MFSFFTKYYSLQDSKICVGATDHHSHILYGVDDGVQTQEESLRILDLLEKEGLKTLWLTPHTMEDVPNTTEALKARFEELKAAYKGGIELHLGAEYMIDTLFEEHLENNDLLIHGKNRILVETSTWNPPFNLWEILQKIESKGYFPIIAHPERYHYMRSADYDRLKEMGCLFQLNISSYLGLYGEAASNKAHKLLEKGYYDMVGSDCHRYSIMHQILESRTIKKGDLEKIAELYKFE
ncbi:MAG: capsular biosynthesis protein [Bacteroidales bacterium]|nr:capsular biosynthesis protein [Bacteroidales bacterium]